MCSSDLLTADIVVTGSVDVDSFGVHVLTYKVSDAAGNEADPVTRDVVVYDPDVVFAYSDPFFLGTALLDNFSSSPDVGGAVATYSISPDLPAGITLVAETGVISGTPTEENERTTYTIIGVNETVAGSAEVIRSEEHTSELQSRRNLVCRLPL